MDFLQDFDLATLAAVGVLAFYVLLALSIFIYRLSNLSAFANTERASLASLIRSRTLGFDSYFKPALSDKNRQVVLLHQANSSLAEGLTWLNIIATTSPFIGLFGTVVSIYFTLISLSSGAGDIAKIASPIGHALIATAAGIISAVLAYTFSLIVRAKYQECLGLLDAELEILQSATPSENPAATASNRYAQE